VPVTETETTVTARVPGSQLSQRAQRARPPARHGTVGRRSRACASWPRVTGERDRGARSGGPWPPLRGGRGGVRGAGAPIDQGHRAERLKRERTVGGGWSLRKRVNCQLSNQPITRVDRYSLVFV
jgi:hypothetical protein